MPLAAASPHNLWSDTSGAQRGPLPELAWCCRSAAVSGGTKQYERFRDTIFLNYWAIVFVQDVVFNFIQMSNIFMSFLWVFFFFFVKLGCLCHFFFSL